MAQDWFRHDFNAHLDPKLISLRLEKGYEGIGVYWTLIEIIGQAENRRWGSYSLPMLADIGRLSLAMLEEYISLLVKLELLCRDENWIWSSGTQKRMEQFDESKRVLSEAGKKGANKRWNKQSDSNPNSPPINHPTGGANAPPNEVAYGKRREEERREEETPPHSPPHDFDRVLAVWRSVRERESGKVDSLTGFEIQQLNGKFWGHGPEKIIAAIEGLGRLHFHATLDQIERWLKGEKFNSQKRAGATAQTQAPKTPAFKPKPKAKATVTAAEAFAEERQTSELPF